jgi:phosphate-selective porin
MRKCIGLLVLFILPLWMQGQQVRRTGKGFEFSTLDSAYALQIEARFQFRYAYPRDQDPVTFDDFKAGKQQVFSLNRARLKIGGHAYQPWLKYYFEYELSQSNLLDFRVMIEKWKGLSFKVGQWKVDYNRERSISSGQQQMIERSIINRPFTVDRQQGVAVYGHLDKPHAPNIQYWLSVLTGTGRGNRQNDDAKLMYVGRLQWNPLKALVPMQGSDVNFSPKPALSIAVAAATNRSNYTRFSQAGGGQLQGFPEGVPGQYRVKQALIETAFMYKGFSWQHESHWKSVNDRVNKTKTPMQGNLMQAGYFLHGLIPSIPPNLELALLYAQFVPDTRIDNKSQTEFSTAINYFFKKHKHKLTLQYDRIKLEQKNVDEEDGGRIRVQWDISF